MRKAKKNMAPILWITVCVCMCVFSGCAAMKNNSEFIPSNSSSDVDVAISSSSQQSTAQSIVSSMPTSQSTVPTDPTPASTAVTTAPTVPTTIPIAPTTIPTIPVETEPAYVDPETCVHDYKIVSFEDSTCEKEGKKVSCCAKCGTTLTESVAPKTHTGGKATCQEAAICILCSQPYGSTVSHDMQDATCQSPVTCSMCGLTEGVPTDHYCANPPYDCTKGTVCDFCGTQYIAPTEHVFLEYCMTNAVCIHCGTYSDTLGPIGCTYSNGKCIRCGEKDPDYVAPGGSSGNTGNVKVSFTLTPSFTVSYGKVDNATYSISGDTLNIHITGRRNNDGYGSQSLKVKYKVSAGTYLTTLAEGSEYSSSVSAGSSFSMTISLPGVITSQYKQYYISLS